MKFARSVIPVNWVIKVQPQGQRDKSPPTKSVFLCVSIKHFLIRFWATAITVAVSSPEVTGCPWRGASEANWQTGEKAGESVGMPEWYLSVREAKRTLMMRVGSCPGPNGHTPHTSSAFLSGSWFIPSPPSSVRIMCSTCAFGKELY